MSHESNGSATLDHRIFPRNLKHELERCPDRPVYLSPLLDRIPAGLRAHPIFLYWKAEWQIDKKETGSWRKVPYQVNKGWSRREGRMVRFHARTNDPSTHEVYDHALEQWPYADMDGAGLVLRFGLVGLDIDNCYDPATGTLHPRAKAILDALGAYCEWSPSGTGVKAVFYGSLAKLLRLPQFQGIGSVKDLPKKQEFPELSMGIEVYDQDSPRYFTITGRKIEGYPDDILDRQESFEKVYCAEFRVDVPQARKKRENRQRAATTRREALDLDINDAQVIELAEQAQNRGKFAALYKDGDLSRNKDNASGADLALCQMLAFWCGADVERIDRIFRSSALMRCKWDREDYRLRTIDQAIANTHEYYDWTAHRALASAEERIGEIYAGKVPTIQDDITLKEPAPAVPTPAPETAQDRRRRGYLISDLATIPHLSWQVEGHFPRTSLVSLVGPSGVGKSFIALDLSMSIALGRDYLGTYKVEQGPVLYISAEGFGGTQKRIKAWMQHHGVDAPPTNICFLPDAFDLQADDPGEVDAILDIARQTLGVFPSFVVVDTLNRNFGGGDENNTRDMKLFVSNCDRIRHACNATVVPVHHTGKDASRKERGSVVLRASSDTLILLEDTEGSRAILVACDKQKDFEPFETYTLDKVVVELPGGLPGEETSLALEPADQNRTRHKLLPKDCKALLDALWAEHSCEPFGWTAGYRTSRISGKDTFTGRLHTLRDRGFVVLVPQPTPAKDLYRIPLAMMGIRETMTRC